jgi:type III restriction enzyme
LEVTGTRDEKKATKVPTVQDLWVEAVSNHGGFGRWAFLEISGPWDARNTIREAISEC